MKVLVIGSGGREHALVWKTRQSPLADTVFCAPGNAGIQELAECVEIPPTDISRLLGFAKTNKIGLICSRFFQIHHHLFPVGCHTTVSSARKRNA